MTQRVFFFACEQSAHDQDAASHADFAQNDAFVGRGNAKPLCACLFQSRCALFHTVAIGVTLNYRTNLNFWPDVILQNAEVMAQGR